MKENFFLERTHKSLWDSPPTFTFSNFGLVELGSKFKIFEFRGCNGSGKSSLPKSLIKSDHLSQTITHKSGVVLTECPTFNTVIVGSYPDNANCGGCDRISGNDNIARAVEVAVEYVLSLPDSPLGRRILFEGIMASTTCVAILDKLIERDNGINQEDINICFMDTPLEICLERISNRNGGKSFKTDNVSNKHRQVNNQPNRLKEEYPKVSIFSIENSTPEHFKTMLMNWCELSYNPYFNNPNR